MDPAIAFFLFVGGLWLIVTCLKSSSPQDIYGPVNPAMICPHCQQTGGVRTQRQRVKDGISGAKAAGAVVTGGTSVLVTGLSKKTPVLQAHCEACQTDWTIR